MHQHNDLITKLLEDDEKSNWGLPLPSVKSSDTDLGPGKHRTGREFSRSWEPKQHFLPNSRNQALSFDISVPGREILRKKSFFDTPFTSIYGLNYSRDKFNAISQKIMEMGFTSDQALAGIVITDAHGVSEAVNAISDLPPVPSQHKFIARTCYAGDDSKARHYLLNQIEGNSTYLRWPWNVPDENLCALCGLPKQLFHVGDHNLLDIFGESWSKIRRAKDAVSRTYDDLKTRDLMSISPASRERSEVKINAQLEQKGKESGNTLRCGICWVDQPAVSFAVAPCGHLYCNDCLKQHYRIKIMQGDVLRLPCPYVDDNNFPCDREIEEEEILFFCDDEMKEKFLRFKECRLIQLNDKARFCPKAGCNGWAIGSKWKSKLTCPVCKYVYCWKCTNDWHGYLSRCVNPHDGLFLLFTLGKDIQKCPKCKVRIWKNDGCNHMTCNYCHYEFCWLCRGRYTNNHFEPWNLFGCPGAMYFDWLRCPACCPRFVNRFFIIIFLLAVALPLTIVCGCIAAVMALLLCILWLVMWIATIIPGICVTKKYRTPCGCRDYWC